MNTGETILDFYKDRSVFITGATGFMGKILVEKILRSIPDIGRVYLLIRPSRGKDVHCRLQEELIDSKVFEWLRENRATELGKLIPINGDVSLPNLGISNCDLQGLQNSVSVVFHSAARVKFDDDLRSAFDANVKGPKTVSTFCRQLKNLKAFVHVSTAFNNLDKNEIDEKIYSGNLDPQKLLELLDSMNDHLLASITKQLVGDCPNVYAYTKALGEQLLQSECDAHDIPLVIVRPSIVTAAMKEPLPGWIDNFNGPSGLVAGIGKGLIRSVRVNSELIADLIPVDFPINLMIAAAWDRSNEFSLNKKIPVYNCSSGTLNPIKWKEFKRLATWVGEKFPLKDMMWFPEANLRTNNFIFKMEIALYHYLPGIAFDAIAALRGQKPFLIRLYKKVHRGMSCLEFYTMRQWNFVSRNSVQLMDKMSVDDKNTFYFDVEQINWETYMESYIIGLREYLLKEDSSNLPVARRNFKRMKRLRTLVRLMVMALTLFFFYYFLETSFSWINFETSTRNRSSYFQIGIDHEILDETVMKSHLLQPQLAYL